MRGVGETADGGGRGRRERETHRRVTFQCQLYNAFYYAGALLWGNTAMKKRGRRRDERGWAERAGEERNCTARVSYRVITILGHFHPSPPTLSITGFLPLTRLPLPPSATSSDIKLFIVHNGASSFVKSKKKKEKYKWKKPAERTTLPARKRGASSNLSISLVSVSSHCPRRFCLAFLSPFLSFLFLIQRMRKHDRRAIDPKTLYSETRQRNAEYRLKFTFVMARNKYLFDRTLFQLFI